MPKRTQFSSCDRCRRSRLGCDASFVDQVGSAMTCTRCKKQNQHCSFNWMKNVTVPESSKRAQARQLRSRHRAHESSERDTTSPSASLSDIHLVGSDVVSPIGTRSDTQTQATATCFNGTTAQHAVSSQSDLFRDRASRIIYENCFDVVFGSWMGCHGCPFVLADSNHAKEHVHIAKTCSRLDAWITEASMDDPEHAQGLQQQNKKTDESLNQAILAFSIRWLPIVDKSRNNDSVFEAEVASAWRQARRDMLRIINRPSYRSVLSLFLFAVTPIPIGISVDEEADGISGQACISAALQQIQALRARQRELRFNGSNVSPAVSQKQITVRLEPLLSPEFLMAESTAFWAALTFDTSASLTLNCRPVLSSGLFGFEFESPWRLVRAESKTFQQTYDTWKNSGESINITDDKANHIIASATGWKLLAWKLTAVFKEAIRDAHNESEVKKTHESIVLCMEEFDSIYRGPLQACFDRMH